MVEALKKFAKENPLMILSFWLSAILIPVFLVLSLGDFSLRISEGALNVIGVLGGVLLAMPLYKFVTRRKDSKKTSKVFAIIIAIVVIIFLVILIPAAREDMKYSNGGSEWDNLSDEEKEWYEDNYGDGGFDSIQDAISNYND